jgi:general secretion pathway protein D
VIHSSEHRRGQALAVALAFVFLAGCASHRAFRQGNAEAKKGNWDMAVARLTKAVAHSPDNVRYRLALDDARSQAARIHAEQGRALLAAGELEKGREQFEIAVKFDPVNTGIAAGLEDARARIRRRDDEQREVSDKEAARVRARAGHYPAPELSPRSQKPIGLKFTDASLKLVLETLGKVSGVNILFDPEFKDKQVSFNVGGITFKEAVEQLTVANRLFYKVIDPNTLIVVPETKQKHQIYDEQYVRTFYLQNVDDKDGVTGIATGLGKVIQGAKTHADAQLGAITMIGTADQLAVAEKVIAAHDKPRGEVIVEVRIIEVNRDKARDWGIKISNQTVGTTFAPTAAPDKEDTSGMVGLRAHLLSSLNLSDFIVSVPSSIVARFIETESTARLLASPRLRAAEGKKASLNIVSEIPVPTTTFNSGFDTTGGTTGSSGLPFATTSFQLKQVGLKLDITPTIGSSNEVTLELKAEFGSEGAGRPVGGVTIPTFNTRTVEGQIRVRDGETSLIGGLLQQNEQLTLSGILGVQHIPIVGRFFSSPHVQRTNTEMLISLTPHIVRAPHIAESDTLPLDTGSQDRMRVRSAEAPMFEAGEAPAAPVAPAPSGPASPTLAPVPSSTPQPTPVAPPPIPENAPAASAAPDPAAGPPADALLTASRTQLGRGEATTISVVVRRVRALDGIEVNASFDPSTLQVMSVIPGGLLTLGGRGVESSVTQPEPGRVRARFTLAPSAQPAPSGSGVVATLTIRAVKEGATSFRVESIRSVGQPGGDVATAPPALALTVAVPPTAAPPTTPGGPQ